MNTHDLLNNIRKNYVGTAAEHDLLRSLANDYGEALMRHERELEAIRDELAETDRFNRELVSTLRQQIPLDEAARQLAHERRIDSELDPVESWPGDQLICGLENAGLTAEDLERFAAKLRARAEME